MPTFIFKEQKYQANENQTVLDALINNGIEIQNSCRSGVCQSCLLKTESTVESLAQKGLKDTQKKEGLFFSCQQTVVEGMEIFECHESNKSSVGVIIAQEPLSASVVLVKIDIKDKSFGYNAGQFINLVRSDGLCRPYSIANQSGRNIIELHVRRIPGGVMSEWLYGDDLLGQEVKITGPIGECYYQDVYSDQDLLLVGTGTGLAPLCGILLDALESNHSKKIYLHHGALDEEGLYYVEKLKSLANENPNFEYIPAVLKGDSDKYNVGNIVDIIKEAKLNVKDTTTFICGDPDIVKAIKEIVFLKGVSSKKIFSDPFVISKKTCSV